MEKLDRKKNPQVEDIMANTTFVMADAMYFYKLKI